MRGAIEGAGAAPAAGNNNPLDPRPAPPAPGGNPLERPAPQNPLERERPAAPANPLAGAFKGEELSADFQIAGAKVTGSITKGGKQYRVTGTAQGNRVVGAFEVAGVEFNFAATLEGETLTLDSEGNKYTMKKVGGAAPAPERPRNPLE